MRALDKDTGVFSFFFWSTGPDNCIKSRKNMPERSIYWELSPVCIYITRQCDFGIDNVYNANINIKSNRDFHDNNFTVTHTNKT